MKQKIRVIILLLLLIVVIGSIMFITKNKNSESKSKQEILYYNNFKFKKGIIGWYTLIKVGNRSFNVSFLYSPKEVENISVEKRINDLILKKKLIYITTDPFYSARVSQAQVEISKITSPRTHVFGILNIPTMITVTYIPEGYEYKNIKPADCSMANESIGVIKLLIGDENKVYKKDGCVIVEGKNEYEIVKVADRLSYNLLGIIPP